MRFLPAFFDLRKASIAIVGGGWAAASKLRLLRGCGARLRWYPAGADVAARAGGEPQDDLEVCFDDPRNADFSSFTAVICAAGGTLDEDVAALARRSNVPVNVVDRPDLSSFIFPAIVDRGDVVVAIGTGGAAPVLARRLRERIEAVLPARIGELAALMGRFRARAAQARHGGNSMREFWEQVVDGAIGAAALAGRRHEAEAALARAIDSADQTKTRPGTVYLVGAGPGDADLLTLRALQALQAADAVYYGDGVGAGILDRARRDAVRVFVGKRRAASDRGRISKTLADAVRSGLTVAYLKSGDAFGFGSEEARDLRQAGIAAIVVPGVTALNSRTTSGATKDIAPEEIAA